MAVFMPFVNREGCVATQDVQQLSLACKQSGCWTNEMYDMLTARITGVSSIRVGDCLRHIERILQDVVAVQPILAQMHEAWARVRS